MGEQIEQAVDSIESCVVFKTKKMNKDEKITFNDT